MIETITILGGHGKSGAPEPVRRLDLRMGDVVSIVGPTGSGKTTLINDIELFADAEYADGPARPHQRHAPLRREYRDDPARNPIALITQHTTFLSDLPVANSCSPMRASAARAGTQIEKTGGAHAELRQPADGRADPRREPHDGALRRPDARAPHRRRDDHLQHADRAARRGRERRHPPHPGAGAVARSTARSSSSSPTIRASRCCRTIAS